MPVPPIFVTQQILRAQITLADPGPDRSMDSVNTFHFAVDDQVDLATISAGAIKTALVNYYAAFGEWLSQSVSRTTSGFKTYDLSLPKPNPPVYASVMTLPAAGVNWDALLPREVSLCVSYKADPVAGVEPRSLRGRNFFGPIMSPTAPAGNNYLVPPPGLIAACAAAGDSLLEASKAATTWKWVVFSPTMAGGWMIPGQQGPPNLQGSASLVTSGWVDNEWDTQRSRGMKPSARTNFS